MDKSRISQLLTQLLSAGPPELGARLKQRLNAAFQKDGLGRFDEKELGYAKFKDYLEAEFGELLEINTRAVPSDITVSIRSAPLSQGKTEPSLRTAHLPIIRSEVWTAFANPDPRRKRFLHRSSGAVKHFLSDENSQEEKDVAASPKEYAEILPVPGDVQTGWMREFVAELALDDNSRAPLDALANGPYSSALNATFTRALEENAGSWRARRTKRVIAEIEKWAKQQDVPMSLLDLPKPDVEVKKHRPAAMESVREQATKMLDLLSEEELGSVVIPVLASVLLIRHRR